MEKWVTDHASWFTFVGLVLAVVQQPIMLMLRTRHRSAIIVAASPVILFLAWIAASDIGVGYRIGAVAVLFASAIVAGVKGLTAITEEKPRGIPCDLLLDSEAIVKEGMKHLGSAKRSFDMIAVALTRTMAVYEPTIRDKANAGVIVRLILLDPDDAQTNTIFERSLNLNNGSLSAATRNAIKALASIVQRRLSPDKQGNIKLCLLTGKTPLYSMWIADSSHAYTVA